MHKAFLKRTADALEKIAVGSILIALYQGSIFGAIVASICMIFSYILTYWEAKI